ncbi:unnamed protein product [Vitrella brassicaformis CCMP3155]|uniref:Uncharacterized protein n=1 Tax=Vitrella brassicaformis (strain CCMP3155) TaxID=1169540 RepID=A0A0G4FG39_VITBC|nr:unnamed protein product [Vitrella brassicaformis CCMP3155]|eukprot:CEM12118.1 unnamed protein product [Vitrella brassicaformis CCMP3155]
MSEQRQQGWSSDGPPVPRGPGGVAKREPDLEPMDSSGQDEPQIPTLEEADDDDHTQHQVAAPPAFLKVLKPVSIKKDFRSTLLLHPEEGVDLSILTTTLCSEKAIREAEQDVLWDYDILFSEIASSLRSQTFEDTDTHSKTNMATQGGVAYDLPY